MNKAERLATALETEAETGLHIVKAKTTHEAAAELRRLVAINAELVEALEAIEPFIPVTSAKEGGASKYSANVHAADKVREALQKVKQ